MEEIVVIVIALFLCFSFSQFRHIKKRNFWKKW